MENLIAIEGKEKEQFKNLQELVKGLLNNNYYEMTNEEKENVLEMKAIANCMFRKIQIVKNIDNINDNSFIIYDEITYILSLLKINKIILLEKKEANIFGKYIDMSQIKENYIILNSFAKEILINYLKE